MTDRRVILTVVTALAVTVVLAIAGVVVLAIMDKQPPDILSNLAATSVGALGAVLASTRSDYSATVPVERPVTLVNSSDVDEDDEVEDPIDSVPAPPPTIKGR